MRLMISVVSATEARQALLGGADLLDVKNPAEGSLGAQFPRVIREIKEVSAGRIEISAAIGDMPNLPGTAALAALGAACCGVDYIKIGLHGPGTEAEAADLLREVQEAVCGTATSVIAACYADYERAGTLNPHCLPSLAASVSIRGCLVDTAVKDGRTLFDFLDVETLCRMATQAHASGLLFGAAGALREQDLLLLKKAGVDIVGVRTAVCRDQQRTGPLDPIRVRSLVSKLKT
jgi:(5-formylfuran-3-yl)methyl phosphate synthase